MAIELDRLVTILGFKTDLSGVAAFERRVDNIQDKMSDVGDSMTRVGAGIAAFGGAISAGFAAAAGAAISWETDFTGVRKTIDGTEADFARLEERLREMARQDVPLPVGELAALAESAGQLGIQTEFVGDFVETMAQLGVTTNLSSEAAATGLARLANIMGTSQDNFGRLGSTIVDLGNNLATTESEILSIGLRLAGTGKLVGLTEAQTLAFGAALSSVGIEAEAGGTAFSRIWADMQAAVQTGGDELEAFGRVAGMTGGEFAGLFELMGADDATQAFIAGLQRMIDDGENVHEVLVDLGFDGIRVRDALLRAAGAGDLFTNALELGNEAWAENAALTREAELRFATADSQIQFIKNDIRELAITIGGILLPVLKDLLRDVRPIVERVIAWAEANPKLVKTVATLGVVALGVGTALGGIGLSLKAISFALGGLATGAAAIQGIAGAFGALRLAAITAAPAIWGALAPLLPILLPIAAAIIAAAVAIWYYWTPISTFFQGVWDGMQEGSGETSAAMERLGAAFGRLREELGPLGAVLEPVVNLLRELFSGRSDTDATEQGLSFGQALSEEIVNAIDTFTAMIDSIATLVGWIAQLIAWFNQVRDAVADFNEAISPENVFAQLGSLNDYLSQFSLYDAGRGLFQTFIDGITAPGDELKAAIDGKLQEIRNLLPFSDAREGPLADITMSGRSLPETFAQGIMRAGNAVARAMQGAIPVLRPADDAGQVMQVATPDIAIPMPDMPAVSMAMPDMSAMPPVSAVQGVSDLGNGIMPMLRNLLPELNMPLPDGSIGDALMSAIPNLAAPLPVGPAPAPALAAAGAGGGSPSSISVTIDNITVTVPNGDAESIGLELGDRLRDVFRTVAEEFDTQIRA